MKVPDGIPFMAKGVQRSAKDLVRGCEKFVPALAYLFCLALPGSCLARFTSLLVRLCTNTVHTGYIVQSVYKTIKNEHQLNSVDGITYQSILSHKDVGQCWLF